MQNYIVSRLRTEANRMLAMAENEKALQHPGVKGRFRELLVDTMLSPWLPPYVGCGTGMIIDIYNKARSKSQDDIILYDKSLAPPIFASLNAPEGVFLVNSVLARIEVKSTLTRQDILEFLISSREVSELLFVVTPGHPKLNLFGALNFLFAYASNAQGKNDRDYQFNRVLSVMKENGVNPLSGIISAVCMPGHGFWLLEETCGVRYWKRLDSERPEDHVTWFIANISSACFQQHAAREGREPMSGIDAGIGRFIPDNCYSSVPLP